jgi:hypothetical protein
LSDRLRDSAEQRDTVVSASNQQGDTIAQEKQTLVMPSKRAAQVLVSSYSNRLAIRKCRGTRQDKESRERNVDKEKRKTAALLNARCVKAVAKMLV